MMTTDAQILTAAREMAAAVEAIKVADSAKLEADRAQLEAAKKCEEARKRATEAQRVLLNLASQKPAEPAPKVEPVKPPEPVVGIPGAAYVPVANVKPAPVQNLSNQPRRGATHVPPARTGN